MSDDKRYRDDHAPQPPSYHETPLPPHDPFVQPHDFKLVDVSKDGVHHCATTNRYAGYAAEVKCLEERLAKANAQAAAGQRFKDFVHGWLDAEKVPADPFPDETARHGCRISGRLRWYRDMRPAGPIQLLMLAVRRYLQRRDDGAEPIERLRLGDEMRDCLKLCDATERKNHA